MISGGGIGGSGGGANTPTPRISYLCQHTGNLSRRFGCSKPPRPLTSIGDSEAVNLVYPKILTSGIPLKQFVRPAMSSIVRVLPCQLILGSSGNMNNVFIFRATDLYSSRSV